MTAKAPKSIKLARGTYRRDRDAGGEQQPQPGRPEKPSGMGPVASAKWDEIVALLEAEGQLSPLYGDFIAEYCRAHQDVADAERIIADEGEICVSEKGGRYQHPAVGMKNKAIDRLMKFGRQLGVSAQSVKHVQKAPKRETSDSKKRFFDRHA